MWDVDTRVHIYTAKALVRGRVASPTLGHLYSPGKDPDCHFIGGRVDPRTIISRKVNIKRDIEKFSKIEIAISLKHKIRFNLLNLRPIKILYRTKLVEKSILKNLPKEWKKISTAPTPGIKPGPSSP